MAYSSTLKELLKILTTNDILPYDSSIHRKPVNHHGITNIDEYSVYKANLPTESEKSITTGKYGFPLQDGADLFWPHYVKHYNLQSTYEILDRILVSSTLEGGTTPLPTYAVALKDGKAGNIPLVSSTSMDLTRLTTRDEHKPVKTIRLDRLLSKAGFPGKFPDLNSFLDIQNFVNNEAINQLLSPRAIIQVALASYFIPNAIGETDANSRNIILADTGYGKFDIAFRIDGESNTYLRDMYNERSGHKLIPKGIYTANETQEEFLMNIKSNSVTNGPKIDWELFMGFIELTDHYVSRDYLDDAIARGYLRNQHRYNAPRDDHIAQVRMKSSRLSQDEYAAFSEATIIRAKKYMTNVKSALGFVHTKYPFEGKLNEQINPKLDTALLDRKGKIYDKNGNPLEPEDFQPSL